MTKYRFRLSFAQIECDRCHGARVRGVACPDCGMAPARWEVDVDVQRRQSIVQDLHAAVASDATGADRRSDFESPLEVFTVLAPWLPSFLETLSENTRNNFRHVDRLHAAIREYVGIREAAKGLRPERPFRRPCEASQRILEGVGLLISEYLTAVAARTPFEAQQRAEAAQILMNDLADSAAELNDWLERRALVGASSGAAESLSALLREAADRAGVDTLLELVAHHQAGLADTLDGPIDEGVAFTHAIQSSAADLFLDPVAYTEKLRTAGAVFESAGKEFDDLLACADFQADLRRLELELYDSTVQCQHLIATARLPRQSAKAVISLNKSLVEAAGCLVAAPLLAAVGAKSKSYAKLRHDNATELIPLVRRREDVRSLVGGLDPNLKNADSHLKSIYGDDFLTTDLAQGATVYEYSELTNSTFEALESCMAVILGVRHAMALRGIGERDEIGLASLGLTTQEIIDVCLPAFGASVISAQLTRDRLVLRVPTESPTGISVALVGTLTGIASEEVDTIELVLPSGRHWSTPASAYRRNRDGDADDFDSQAALIQMQANWRNDDGESWLPPEALRCWTARQASQAIGLDTRDKFRRLRDLRILAAELGDTELASTLKSLTAAVRVLDQDQQPTARESAAIDTVQSWGERDVDVVLI